MVKKDPIKVSEGKKARARGQRFEIKVRKDLEEKGWIVDKWTNNVVDGELVKVKNKFRGINIPMMLGAGFCDFICFMWTNDEEDCGYELPSGEWDRTRLTYQIIGVESKMNGILSKVEKEKCDWLLKNRIFSNILIASKGEKRGEILYTKFISKKVEVQGEK